MILCREGYKQKIENISAGYSNQHEDGFNSVLYYFSYRILYAYMLAILWIPARIFFLLGEKQWKKKQNKNTYSRIYAQSLSHPTHIRMRRIHDGVQ